MIPLLLNSLTNILLIKTSHNNIGINLRIIVFVMQNASMNL